MKKNNWSITGIWNEELTFGRNERELKKRDHIWASELGKNHLERWLKMNAIAPDFDYEERVLRKFEAGNFFERIVGFVLMSAGLLIYDNKWYQVPADENHLAVSVKPDFVAGGDIDWKKAEKRINEEELFKLMPNLGRIAKKLVQHFATKYDKGLKKLVFEIKSVNSQVFWAKKDYLGQAYPHHKLQCFAEMKATGLPEGRILYISKDDLTTAEFPVFIDDKDLNELYETDVRKMTHWIKNEKKPPRTPSVVFDDRKKLKFQANNKKYTIQGCYTDNWEVEWSNYICQLTGIKKVDKNGKPRSKETIVAIFKNMNKPKIKELNDKLKEDYKLKLK